jgi:hypothetical protein
MTQEYFPKDQGIQLTPMYQMSATQLEVYIDSELDRLGDYVPLTPLMQCDRRVFLDKVLVAMNQREGQGHMAAGTTRMRRDAPRTYRLRVCCDGRGNQVQPGDVFAYKVGNMEINPNTRKPISTREIRSFAQRGIDRAIMAEVTIDAQGCITVPREDAVLLLHRMGNGIAEGRPVSSDGMRYNHRLEEVPPWVELEPLAPVVEPHVAAAEPTRSRRSK